MSTQEDLKIAITVLLKSGSGKLTFRNKRLQNIPNNIDQFKFLTSLDLRSNLLITLPHAFSKLSQLQSLNLRRNQFQHLPSALQYLSTLQTLHLSENQLDFLEPTIIASLCNLQQFSVNHNHLRSLPSSISCLMKLEVLNVSHNTIAELPESICNLRKLKLLDAGFNRLTCLPYYMGEIIALEKVYLQKNQLLELPESFTDLLNLQVVDVAANQIRILPTKFSELRLTELHIEANPLLQLRAVPSLQEEEVLPLKELAARFVMKHMQDKRSFLRLSIRSYPELKDLLSQCSTCALCQGAFLNTWLECVRFVDVKSQQSSADRSSSSSNISKLRIPERVLLCSYACFNAPEHEFYGVANVN